MLQKQEIDQIDKGWAKIMIIWIALLSSLGIYLVVCTVIENQIPVSMEGAPLERFKYILFGISALTLVGAYFFRKLLLKNISRPAAEGVGMAGLHPAVSKYLTSIVIIMALSESVGIYGVVLFLISKDAVSFYQLMSLSAIAMVIFCPKKAELIGVAEKMKSAGSE